jgi:hypothetical protein
MANPRLKKLRQLRRQAAESGNEKRFSNLTNRIRDKRGLSPLSDDRKNKIFKRLGGPDNTTFNRQPLPGGGRIMKRPQQGGLQEMQAPARIQPGRLRKPGQPDNTTFNRQPLPGGGRIMKRPQQMQGSKEIEYTGSQQMQGPGTGILTGLPSVPQVGGQTDFQGRPRPVPYKDGGEVESMPMGERPYKEEKGKKNSMRGVGKAIQGTKFKGVF